METYEQYKARRERYEEYRRRYKREKEQEGFTMIFIFTFSVITGIALGAALDSFTAGFIGMFVYPIVAVVNYSFNNGWVWFAAIAVACIVWFVVWPWMLIGCFFYFVAIVTMFDMPSNA